MKTTVDFCDALKAAVRFAKCEEETPVLINASHEDTHELMGYAAFVSPIFQVDKIPGSAGTWGELPVFEINGQSSLVCQSGKQYAI